MVSSYIFLSAGEVEELSRAAECILRLIGYAEGRADSYAAEREQVIQFPIIKAKERSNEKCKKN